MTARHRLTAIGAAVTAAAIIVVSGTDAAPPDRSPGTLARQLAAAPAIDRQDPTAVRLTDLRAAADRIAADIPLPDGGTFSGVRWEQFGDPFPVAGIEGILEYNAACQWLRARRDAPRSPVAAEVLQQIPKWPALRDTESAAVLSDAIAGRPVLAGVLADCDASVDRERTYARQLGLPPTS